MELLPDALTGLSAVNQFVLWKAVPSKTRPGKVDKFPMSINGKVIDAHDPQYWLSAQDAIDALPLYGENHGVGFVFTSRDPFFFLDIDGAYDASGWSALATQLCASMSGCAVEVSHSGRGLHIFGTYEGDEPDHGCKNIPLGLELYTSGRFCALTGNGATGNVNHNGTLQLESVTAQYFPLSQDVDRPTAEWTTTHVEGSYPVEDDDRLLEKALKSTSRFGQSAMFKDLWNADESTLAGFYPDEDGKRSYDASSVDSALAQHLCWWTGNNCERVERLMRRSALVRPKWDYHKSYMERTILGCASRTINWYDKGKPVEVVEAVKVGVTLKEGDQFIASTQQLEMFKGCVYITDMHRILTPAGSLLKAEQFNAVYGGFSFAADHTGDKVTKKAWEAFTESQVINFTKVDSTCFRPQFDSGAIVTEEGRTLVNVYTPLDIVTTDGDITPFKTHLTKLLPNERDQTILMSYMAACIQHKGHKIQWAPLIQGCEGNGKTLFTRVMKYALGTRYTHMPKASQLDSQFNGWLVNKLFIGVEDIFVSDHNVDVLETLKPMITGGDGLEIQMKGVDQTTSDVCANFMFNSNHKNAIKTTLNDRRFCVFYTAQQSNEDVQREGMNGEYFANLYKWLRNGGFAAVAGFLTRYQIPAEFDCSENGSCQRAPTTTSTMEAVTASLGGVEQEILDAIDEGRQGFAGGWVSSIALEGLLEKMRKNNQVPRNKRLELMRSLGYDYHPALRDGRVNNVSIMDNGRKPRLYIKNGHINRNITSPAEVLRVYGADQGDLLGRLADVSESNVQQ